MIINEVPLPHNNHTRRHPGMELKDLMGYNTHVIMTGKGVPGYVGLETF